MSGPSPALSAALSADPATDPRDILAPEGPALPRSARLAAHLGGWGYEALTWLPRPMARAILQALQRHRRPRPRDVASLPVTATRFGHAPLIWLARDKAPAGVILYLHGGGYIGGPSAKQWRWLAELHRQTGLAIAVPLYRIAPRHPFPAGWRDVLAALDGLRAEGLLAPGRWLLLGDSAGAGMALALAQQGHADGAAGLGLIAPWAQMDIPESRRSSDPLLTPHWLARAARSYAGGTPLSAPQLSPLGGRMDGLPPVHLSIGTRDLFLPDARALRDRLRAAGNPTRYYEQAGGLHTFPLLLGTEQGRAATADLADWMRGLRQASRAA